LLYGTVLVWVPHLPLVSARSGHHFMIFSVISVGIECQVFSWDVLALDL
jgi:hypothetical protein